MAAMEPNPTLSDDLISEILVRVPVKSLLCFQSVCKAWLSLIKHPAFVKSQLRHAIKTKTDETLIINSYNYQETNYQETKFSLLDVDSRKIVADLKFPHSRGESVPCRILVGSVNGMVCFTFAKPESEKRICLWNPATRQSKLIPLFNKFNALGFGYDSIDHEYKVVSIGHRECYSVEVYLANREEWRKVPDPIGIPHPIEIPSNGLFDVCVNGFLCGIGKYGMMVFDLHKEVLNCAIKLPIIIRDVRNDDETRIIEFNKSVAVIILWDNRLNDNKKKIKMWSLNDDACLGGGGVEASWMPMFSIDLAMPARLILSYFNNRDLVVLIGHDMWISCNVDKKEANMFPLSVESLDGKHYSGVVDKKEAKMFPLSVERDGKHYTSVVCKYTESLVSVTGFKHINLNAGEDDN